MWNVKFANKKLPVSKWADGTTCFDKSKIFEQIYIIRVFVFNADRRIGCTISTDEGTIQWPTLQFYLFRHFDARMTNGSAIALAVKSQIGLDEPPLIITRWQPRWCTMGVAKGPIGPKCRNTNKLTVLSSSVGLGISACAAKHRLYRLPKFVYEFPSNPQKFANHPAM